MVKKVRLFVKNMIMRMMIRIMSEGGTQSSIPLSANFSNKDESYFELRVILSNKFRGLNSVELLIFFKVK